jgi:hypothetical protein
MQKLVKFSSMSNPLNAQIIFPTSHGAYGAYSVVLLVGARPPHKYIFKIELF